MIHRLQNLTIQSLGRTYFSRQVAVQSTPKSSFVSFDTKFSYLLKLSALKSEFSHSMIVLDDTVFLANFDLGIKRNEKFLSFVTTG